MAALAKKPVQSTVKKHDATTEQGYGEVNDGRGESSINPNDPEFFRFSELRGFDVEFLAELGLGIAHPEAVSHAGLWVAIPYLHKTGRWYDRYRRIDYQGHGPKYLSPPGAKPRLYNPVHCGPDSDYVWFCEGEFNCLSLLSAGINAVAVGGATNWKPHWTTLFESATVFIGFDNDEAGKQNAVKATAQFKNGVLFDSYPEGVNDFNDWLLVDKEGMTEVVSSFMSKHGVTV